VLLSDSVVRASRFLLYWVTRCLWEVLCFVAVRQADWAGEGQQRITCLLAELLPTCGFMRSGTSFPCQVVSLMLTSGRLYNNSPAYECKTM
jgi:hypothetical protein